MGYFSRFPSRLETFIDSLTRSMVSALTSVATNLEISHLQCRTDLQSRCGSVLCSVVMSIYAMRKLTSRLIAHTPLSSCLPQVRNCNLRPRSHTAYLLMPVQCVSLYRSIFTLCGFRWL